MSFCRFVTCVRDGQMTIWIYSHKNIAPIWIFFFFTEAASAWKQRVEGQLSASPTYLLFAFLQEVVLGWSEPRLDIIGRKGSDACFQLIRVTSSPSLLLSIRFRVFIVTVDSSFEIIFLPQKPFFVYRLHIKTFTSCLFKGLLALFWQILLTSSFKNKGIFAVTLATAKL